jgi:predicted kinase
MKAFYLIGPPGCGKSTWAKKHLAETKTDTVIVNRDDLIAEWAAEHHLTYNEAYEQHLFWSKDYCAVFDAKEIMRKLDDIFFDAIDENKDIVVDMTNLSNRYRINDLPDYYSVCGIIFKISGEQLEKQLIHRQKTTGKYIPSDSIRGRINSYVPPKKDEFDEIIVLDQDLLNADL